MNSASITASAMRPPTPLALRDPADLDPAQRAQRRARLRDAHTAAGVDPRYLCLPEGMLLWFVHIVLDLEIHASCQGFTKHLYEYAIGSDEHSAVQAVHRRYAALAPEVNIVSACARRSSSEHPEELTFPELVCRDDVPARFPSVTSVGVSL